MIVRNLLSKLRPEARFDAAIAPDGPVYAVGDLHGRADLLDVLLPQIEAHAQANDFGTKTLVFLGDYVDRGEQSAEVLTKVRALQEATPDQVVALIGNHEAMMLKFLDDPVQQGRRWLRFGGLQTLASYGVGGVTERSSPEDLIEAAERLRGAQPPRENEWLRSLPSRWQSGNVAFVHAGADPHLPIADQSDGTLIWGHPEFEQVTRDDGVWVAHGHTVVDAPRAINGRISLDTGAYYTGRLTAGVVTDAGIEMLTT